MRRGTQERSPRSPCACLSWASRTAAWSGKSLINRAAVAAASADAGRFNKRAIARDRIRAAGVSSMLASRPASRQGSRLRRASAELTLRAAPKTTSIVARVSGEQIISTRKCDVLSLPIVGEHLLGSDGRETNWPRDKSGPEMLPPQVSQGAPDASQQKISPPRKDLEDVAAPLRGLRNRLARARRIPDGRLPETAKQTSGEKITGRHMTGPAGTDLAVKAPRQ